MRIGTRITVAATTLVAAALGVSAFLILRSMAQERRVFLDRQARELATVLRVAVESRPDWAASIDALTRGVRTVGLGWTFEFLDEPDENATPAPSDTLLRRALRERKAVSTTTVVEGRRRFVLLQPVFEPSPLSPEGRAFGALALSRDVTYLEEDDRREQMNMLVLVVSLVTLLAGAMLVLTRGGITRPIGKLINGIDGVARGDLSHVVLQEREDELGALADRFNRMTQSLRLAQAETRRSVEARLAMEEHVRQTAQLQMVAQLAVEIAHEVGTPLNVVVGRARALERKADDAQAVQKNATIIAEQAGRITRIIQRLLDLSRRKVGGGERAKVEIAKLAAETLELLEHHTREGGIVASLELAPDLAVLGDRDGLQQVLLNLLLNAVQAMARPTGEPGAEPGEGPRRLTLRVHRAERRRPGLDRAPEQPCVVVEVLDTGPGVPAEERGRIFEPFYTSKGERGGSGLGLPVTQAIVKDHDGWIEVDDNPEGRGARFRVFLPADEAARVA